MSKTALIPIANGSEEIEAVTIIDVLRRADIDVTIASINDTGDLQVSGSHGIQIVADCSIDDCAKTDFDLIAIPGGLPGTEHLAASATLDMILRKQGKRGCWTIKWLLAIPCFSRYQVPKKLTVNLVWLSMATASPARARERHWILP
jgi:putative intracellular protease/amidase